MSKLVKTLIEFNKLLSQSQRNRALSAIRARINKLKDWIDDGNSTPKRVAELAQLKKLVTDTKKRATSLAASQKKPPRSESEQAIKARVQELKEEFAKYKGRPTTPAQRIRLLKRMAARKERIKFRLEAAGAGKTLRLTEEGYELFRGGRGDTPAELDYKLRLLETSLMKRGSSSRFAYETVTGRSRSLTGHPEKGAPIPPRGEHVDTLLHGYPPSHTQRQAMDLLYPPSRELRGRDIDPEELRTGFEIITEGGNPRSVYKKGGYKKYQSRSKLGKREHVYMGGGLVGAIPHFKPKKKVKKK